MITNNPMQLKALIRPKKAGTKRIKIALDMTLLQRDRGRLNYILEDFMPAVESSIISGEYKDFLFNTDEA